MHSFAASFGQLRHDKTYERSQDLAGAHTTWVCKLKELSQQLVWAGGFGPGFLQHVAGAMEAQNTTISPKTRVKKMQK